jgi:prepilin-type N-terminal cleavage/methylation domain-containing protein
MTRTVARRPACVNGSRTAFTLIEVLVVVAIIALLVAILLPSLKLAKEMSRRSVCATHEHQIGLAINTYAQDYKGLMPFEFGLAKDSTPAMREVSNNSVYHVYDSRWFWAANTQGASYYNLGYLWGRYLRVGQVFYCPSMKNPSFMYEEYIPFPDYSADGTRVSYTYNPWVKLANITNYPELTRFFAAYSYRQDYERLYKRIDDPKLKGRILLTDMFSQVEDDDIFSHKAGAGSFGWNCAASDGSVRFLRNRDVYFMIRWTTGEHGYERYDVYLECLRLLNKGAF